MKRKSGSRKFGLALAALTGAYFLLVRPWQLRWGSTGEENQEHLPGDDLIFNPRYQTTRAITIQAAPDRVWPWLVQIGYRRAGFYCYDALGNMMGLQIQSANKIHPEWQNLRTGKTVHIAPNTPLMVEVCQADRTLVLHTVMNPFTARLVNLDSPSRPPYIDWTWTFILQPLGPKETRLIVRTRADYEPELLEPLTIALLEPAHFLMERKMLLGIKERAEG